MVLGPSRGQAGEDDATGLRGSAHWRLAVRGLRLAGLGLFVAVGGFVTRVWSHDSGRRRRYLSRWRRGRLHRIHPGHPSASKAPALVLAAQVAAHARRSPRLAPGSVMNRPEPIRPGLAAATSAGTTRGPTLRRGQRPRPRAAMKKSTPTTRSSRVAATLDHLWQASSPCVDASRTPAALPRSP